MSIKCIVKILYCLSRCPWCNCIIIKCVQKGLPNKYEEFWAQSASLDIWFQFNFWLKKLFLTGTNDSMNWTFLKINFYITWQLSMDWIVKKCKHQSKCKGYGYRQWHVHTVCPRSLDLFYIVTYFIKWGKTSWTARKNQKGLQLRH